METRVNFPAHQVRLVSSPVEGSHSGRRQQAATERGGGMHLKTFLQDVCQGATKLKSQWLTILLRTCTTPKKGVGLRSQNPTGTTSQAQAHSRKGVETISGACGASLLQVKPCRVKDSHLRSMNSSATPWEPLFQSSDEALLS